MDRIKHFLENGVRSNKAMAISWSPYRMNQARSKREVNPISKGHVDIVVKGLEEDLICGSPLSGRANGKARFAIFHLPLSFFFFLFQQFATFHRNWKLANLIITVPTNHTSSYMTDRYRKYFVLKQNSIIPFSLFLQMNIFSTAFSETLNGF